MLYELFGKNNTMQKIDVPENHKKNNLAIGTILQLNGYTYPKSVIVKNLGIRKNAPEEGAKYLTVQLPQSEKEGISFDRQASYLLKYESEKVDDRIQTYITSEVMEADQVLSLYQAARDTETRMKQSNEQASAERKRLVEIGRELFKKHIPESVKALIIAEHEIDDSDVMTDYFNTKTVETVILGWSKHGRDIFSEMRKYAHKIPETEHLAIAPKYNDNGKEKTEENKEWWHPKDEHREKYSMGAGYYLKSKSRYSTGWKISKYSKFNGWSEYLYVALAKRCVL